MTTAHAHALSAEAPTAAETHGRARVPFGDPDEVDEFVETLARYERGEITADHWRAFRLLRGAYGQRQNDDSSMVRIKIPQGVADAALLRAIADAADLYSRGFGHITTRQNIQLHFVKLHDVEKVLRLVTDAGGTTRTACGNSVRTVTACPFAGVARDEPFDVTPYAEALTRYFLRLPLASSLPRKFKIAFEGCATDHIFAAINDIGFTARIQGAGAQARRGFRVTIAGGTSIWPRSGAAFEEFIPAAEILELTEGILRVYHRLGDREHRQRNRLKFLIKELGAERFRAEYEAERRALREEGGIPLPFDAERPPETLGGPPPRRAAPPTVAECAARAATSRVRGPGVTPTITPAPIIDPARYARFLQTNVEPQRQAGYVLVTATVVLGDLSSEQLRILSDLALAYGDGTVRMTPTQNLVFRWVREDEVRELYARLSAAGLGLADAHTLADVTSCPGADTCKLAVTQSRGLGAVLSEFLRSRPDLVDAVPGLDIKISGCPNGCGQHHIAGIGFQGSVRKIGDKPAPQYFVLLGGGVAAEAKFGRIAAKIPARRVTAALERLIQLYVAERAPEELPRAFFQRVPLPRIKALLADLEELNQATVQPEDLIDLGEQAQFAVETQAGECAA